MNKIIERRSIKAGLPSGSLIYTGENKSETLLVKESVDVYIRDLYDNILTIL
ncbi:MAG TPA: hypothetical protein VF839_08590 [Clostridium sp.]